MFTGLLTKTRNAVPKAKANTPMVPNKPMTTPSYAPKPSP